MADAAETFDGVLIVGAGLAGLSAALAAAPRPVMILSPTRLGDAAASAWAQGGMAAALSSDDSPQAHAADTIAAGAGLCDRQAVAALTEEGPLAVQWLAALGVPFDRAANGRFAQALEAAHSRPRVAHIGGDGAGRAIMRAVIKTVLASPSIIVRQGLRLRGLLQDRHGRVRGVIAQGAHGLVRIEAAATLLATGGIGGLYAETTTPTELRGQGLGLAAMAGADIADPEFMQFHPTAIDIGVDPAPLATEALRGEGAILINQDGRRFMPHYHPSAELAPRDVVARAIHAERASGRGALLDTRMAIGPALSVHFPAVFAACMAVGIDPRETAIPVCPAAHYHMGGIATDLHGRSSLLGLFAAGECASTGVHGANRLASNSLLEAVVFGRRAGRAASDVALETGPLDASAICPDLPGEALTSLRHSMSANAGVVRHAAGLARLLDQLTAQTKAHGLAPELITAELVTGQALRRQESRGGHYREDFPQTRDAKRTRLVYRPKTLELAAE